MGFSDTYDLFCGRQQYLQSEFPVCLRGCARASVFFRRLFHIGNAEAVQELICLCGMTVRVYLIGTVILNQDRYKVLHLTCFYKYHSLFFRQLLTGFDGVVYPIAERVLMSSGSMKSTPLKSIKAEKSICFSRAFSALSLMIISRKSLPVWI